MPPARDSVTTFIASYPSRVRELAMSLRTRIRSTIPDATETVDEPARMIGYAVGPGYAGFVCTIIPSKTGVKLGIARGAQIDDPHGLLEGSGKRHRHIQLTEPSDLDRPAWSTS